MDDATWKSSNHYYNIITDQNNSTDNGLYLLYVVPRHTLSPGKATFLHDGFSLLYRGS